MQPQGNGENWGRIRAGTLAAVLAAVVGLLAKGLLAPTPLERPLPAFEFPKTAPVQGWEPGTPEDPAGASYQTEQEGSSLEIRLRFVADVPAFHVADSTLLVRMPPSGSLPLDAGMHYLVDVAGRVQANDKGALQMPAELEVSKGPGGDFHGFWEDGRRLHLSALIGANGHTATTPRELFCNVYLRQFGAGRIARWFLGRAALPDTRCILADISLPVLDLGHDDARRRLEGAWADWYGWCAPAFVKACASADANASAPL